MMMMKVSAIWTATIIVLLMSILSSTSAFVVPSSSVSISTAATTTATVPVASRQRGARKTRTELFERRWNFNEGRAPWGLAKNAEIWNGRVAQMAFVLTFLQELIQGKGVFQGLAEGDPINYVMLGLFAVSTIGLTAFLAIKGDDDYTLE